MKPPHMLFLMGLPMGVAPKSLSDWVASAAASSSGSAWLLRRWDMPRLVPLLRIWRTGQQCKLSAATECDACDRV